MTTLEPKGPCHSIVAADFGTAAAAQDTAVLDAVSETIRAASEDLRTRSEALRAKMSQTNRV